MKDTMTILKEAWEKTLGASGSGFHFALSSVIGVRPVRAGIC